MVFRSLGVLVLLWGASSTQLVSASGIIRIGSWNIKHLSDDSSQHAAALAQHIQLAGVDLLALQEIHDTDDDDDRISNSKLDEALELIEAATGDAWRYQLHPRREGVTRNQHVGVAWNTARLTMAGEPLRIDVRYANRETWKRTPHAVKFNTADGKTDFVVISLHMKSNSPVDGLPDTEIIRRQEAEALVDKLGDVREHFGGEQDLILIGDTNAKRTGEAAIEAYKDAGFRDLNEKDSSTWRSFFEGEERMRPFDRVLVRSDQNEFRFSRQYVLRPADRRGHEDTFSDHWLITAAIRILDDDDP